MRKNILLCFSANISLNVFKKVLKVVRENQASLIILYSKRKQEFAYDELDEETKKMIETIDIRFIGCDRIHNHILFDYINKNNIDCLIFGNTKHSWYDKYLKYGISKKLKGLEVYLYVDDKRLLSSFNDERSINKKLIDFLIMMFFLVCATFVGIIIQKLGFKDIDIIMIYMIGVLFTCFFAYGSVVCYGYAALTVFIYNYFFTEPLYTFRVYDKQYFSSFIIMIITSSIISFVTYRSKRITYETSRKAYRTELLLQTSQKLQKAINKDDIMNKLMQQIGKLLERNVIYFFKDIDKFVGYTYSGNEILPLAETDKAAAGQAMKLNRYTGYSTNIMPEANYLFMTVRNGEKIFAIVGIDMKGKALGKFEESILIAMLAECALALEKEEFVISQNEAFNKLKNEQFRANLLRSISHDLRTPLTSISGNASALLLNKDKMNDEQKIHMYKDIQEDSLWLIGLVENILSITRMENGEINVEKNTEVVSEIIEEAISHVRKKENQKIIFEDCDDIILVKMDASLMIQVIVNLLNNAIKYSYQDSTIKIILKENEDDCIIEIQDDGPGIKPEEKMHVFDMFYSAHRKVVDSHRGIGIGLSLCKSIVLSHDGNISVDDNIPHGSIFTIKLKKETINI